MYYTLESRSKHNFGSDSAPWPEGQKSPITAVHKHLNSIALSTGESGQLGKSIAFPLPVFTSSSAFDKFQNNLDMSQKWKSQIFVCSCTVFKQVILNSFSLGPGWPLSFVCGCTNFWKELKRGTAGMSTTCLVGWLLLCVWLLLWTFRVKIRGWQKMQPVAWTTRDSGKVDTGLLLGTVKSNPVYVKNLVWPHIAEKLKEK